MRHRINRNLRQEETGSVRSLVGFRLGGINPHFLLRVMHRGGLCVISFQTALCIALRTGSQYSSRSFFRRYLQRIIPTDLCVVRACRFVFAGLVCPLSDSRAEFATAVVICYIAWRREFCRTFLFRSSWLAARWTSRQRLSALDSFNCSDR